MEEKLITTETAEQELDSVQHVSCPKSRKIAFDANGNLRTNNLSAYWIPDITVMEVVHGTTYIVTGSYEGTELISRKLERIMARKATEAKECSEKTGDSDEETEG